MKRRAVYWRCGAALALVAATVLHVPSSVSADEPGAPVQAWQRDFDAELRAMLTDGLTVEQQQECIAARDELVAIAAEVARIDAALAEEAKAWDGAAAVPEDEWGVDLSWFEPEYVPEHPVLLRLAREAIKRYEAAGLYERIERASRMPRWPSWDEARLENWPEDPKKDKEAVSASYDQWLRGIGASRCANRMLRARMRLRDGSGAWDGAVSDLETIFRLGHSLCGNRTLGIHASIGSSYGVMACSLICELAIEHRPGADVLRAMAAAFDAGLVLERRSGFVDGECLSFLAGLSRDAEIEAKRWWLPSVIASVEEFRERAGREAKRSFRERWLEPFDEDAFIEQHKHWLNPMDNALDAGLPSVNLPLRLMDRNLCESRGLRLVLAVEIFRSERGALPDVLDALVPGFIAAMPVDPYAPDGRFRYKRIDAAGDADGRDYLLYSVGSDGTDDGGSPAPGDDSWDVLAAVNGKCLRCDYIINRKD